MWKVKVVVWKNNFINKWLQIYDIRNSASACVMIENLHMWIIQFMIDPYCNLDPYCKNFEYLSDIEVTSISKYLPD